MYDTHRGRLNGMNEITTTNALALQSQVHRYTRINRKTDENQLTTRNHISQGRILRKPPLSPRTNTNLRLNSTFMRRHRKQHSLSKQVVLHSVFRLDGIFSRSRHGFSLFLLQKTPPHPPLQPSLRLLLFPISTSLLWLQ